MAPHQRWPERFVHGGTPAAPCVVDVLQRPGPRPFLAIEWADGVPCLRNIDRINRVAALIDYDAPQLTEAGFVGFWRHPIIHPTMFTGAVHALGWPTRWRMLPDVEGRFWLGDEDPDEAIGDAVALDSHPGWLAELRPWEVDLFRGLSRSIDAWLPASGPRPHGGRRRFGERRCVRWMRDCNRRAEAR